MSRFNWIEVELRAQTQNKQQQQEHGKRRTKTTNARGLSSIPVVSGFIVVVRY